jgi:hypothetical protein
MMKVHFVEFEKSAMYDLASELTIGETYFIKGVVNPSIVEGPRDNILINVFHIRLCDYPTYISLQ